MHHPASPQHSQHCVMERVELVSVSRFYLQMAQLHQIPDLRRDGAGDGVLVQLPAIHIHPPQHHVCWEQGGGCDEVDCTRTVPSVPAASQPPSGLLR
jgi:hypothetical protein